MTKKMTYKTCVAGLVCLAFTVVAQAGMITDADIHLTSGAEVGSGNGTLNLILFGFSGGGGVTSNESNGFNGDDANTDMPNGGGSAIIGSYITSVGELRDFYRMNFPDGQGGSTVNQIVLYVDLNEIGQVNHINLNDLQILVDYNDFVPNDNRNDPAGQDISSALQNSTGSNYSGGTVLAYLDPNIQPKSLPLNEQGAGFADLFIETRINPFDDTYSDDTRILFFWDSSEHDDGGDKVFLSGSYTVYVPEPATIGLLISGGLFLLRRRA